MAKDAICTVRVRGYSGAGDGGRSGWVCLPTESAIMVVWELGVRRCRVVSEDDSHLPKVVGEFARVMHNRLGYHYEDDSVETETSRLVGLGHVA